MVGKTQDFQCVPSPWNREELVKNWKLPSAARTSVLPITGDAIDYCIYSRSCFALLSHPKILVQTVCGESMGALPGCSLMEESQWMAHMGTPTGITQSCVHLSSQPRPLQRTSDLWLRMDARSCKGNRNGDFLWWTRN